MWICKQQFEKGKLGPLTFASSLSVALMFKVKQSTLLMSNCCHRPGVGWNWRCCSSWQTDGGQDADTSLFHAHTPMHTHARIQRVSLLPYAYTPVDFNLREKQHVKCLKFKLASDFLLLKMSNSNDELSVIPRVYSARLWICIDVYLLTLNFRTGPFEEEKELRVQSSVATG